jgi:hypothetical protein
MFRHLKGTIYNDKDVRSMLNGIIKTLMFGLSPRDKADNELSLKERVQ